MRIVTGYVLYNPLAGNGKSESDARLLELVLPYKLRFFDMTRITNYEAFLAGMEKGDFLILAGGDGTLNRFVNATAHLACVHKIFCFPIGTGNDFAKDLGKEAFTEPFPITGYLQALPVVEVKGKEYRFLNGVGYGIDGYCCQVGDALKKLPGRKVNYTTIAIKGLLFHYKARNARVTVDGKAYDYKNVWIAPTMLGRYYGGGMIPTPGQDRWDPEGKLSLMVFHGAGRLRTLCIFPGIFKGKHIKHKKRVAIHSGYEITVEFDRPTPLQIDGETIPNVTKYTARSVRIYAKKKEYA